jgi:hypothetical protein
MTTSKRRLATLAVVALSLPGLRGFAQAQDSGDETQERDAKDAKAKPEKAGDAAPAEREAPPSLAAAPIIAPEAAATVGFAPPPSAARLESPNASIQFGALLQPQFELSGSPDAINTSKNLFLRRARFMVGGTLFKSLEYFLQVDYPNLFKYDPSDTMAGTAKNAPGLNIQDAFVTYKPLAAFGDRITRWFDPKIDAGFMLPPLSHNSLESAAKLYGADYFVNTFRRYVTNNTDPFGAAGQSPVGRDAGVQARVLILNGHFDLRVGLFMGRRSTPTPADAMNPAVVAGTNFFRTSGRLQINLLDAEPGFFYQGTYLGARKILSLGAFYEFQDKYKYFGGDLIADLPVGPGIFTAQANVGQWDGGMWLQLIKQRVYMVEVGYLIGPIMLSPMVRFERLTAYTPTPDASIPSEDRLGGGLVFWPYGHNSNLKVFYTRVRRTPSDHAFDVVNVQWQVYYF